MSQSFAIKFGLIWRKQIEAGINPCYSAVAAAHCNNKDCCWRADCYNDGYEDHQSGVGRQHAVAGEGEGEHAQ